MAGGGEGRKQHNVAVCIADSGTSAREENVAWKSGGGGNSGKKDTAREACMAAIAKYDMPSDVATVAEKCERFFDIGVHYHGRMSYSQPATSFALIYTLLC